MATRATSSEQGGGSGPLVSSLGEGETKGVDDWEDGTVRITDQTRLPAEEVVLYLSTAE